MTRFCTWPPASAGRTVHAHLQWLQFTALLKRHPLSSLRASLGLAEIIFRRQNRSSVSPQRARRRHHGLCPSGTAIAPRAPATRGRRHSPPFAGGKGPRRRFGRPGDLRGIGGATEVPRYLGIMDCVIHLSYREALSRVLPQALAAGKPVIAYDFDGADEICMEDRNRLPSSYRRRGTRRATSFATRPRSGFARSLRSNRTRICAGELLD